MRGTRPLRAPTGPNMAYNRAKLWDDTSTAVLALFLLVIWGLCAAVGAGVLYVMWPQIGGRMGWSIHPNDVDLAQRVGLTNILLTQRMEFTNASGIQLTFVCVDTNGNRLAFTPSEDSLRRLTPETGEVPGMCWDRRLTYARPQTAGERLRDILPADWMPLGKS